MGKKLTSQSKKVVFKSSTSGSIKVGIDVSESDFCVAIRWEKDDYSEQVFANDEDGFASFLDWLGSFGDHLFHLVIEATGIYHSGLSVYCYDRAYEVSIVNGMIISKFSKLMFWRAKTDSQDARLISEYGHIHQPALWEPKAVYIDQLRQLYSTYQYLLKVENGFSNRLKTLKREPHCHQINQEVNEDTCSIVKEKLQIIEQQMGAIIQEEEKELFENLTSIPGIGKKSAWVLIMVTGAFENFSCPKALSAYLGLAPRIFESGSSVRGKGHICKLGNKHARKVLYMAAISAKKHNKACRELFERLIAKGKKWKVAIVAVMNKLVKQALAIAISGEKYQEDYIKAK